ncbi:hypothetical protein H312_03377 [Anncaliia algerae PRA339]|uniref:Uncharacterized protein n=1 Tax=Anncaliia algerae PRA339 TaxID=1288291 RepID=A0A059EWD5_9MICR|nr:hypothetical protein H312_03377 [Anncaliia algerae PRA339]
MKVIFITNKEIRFKQFQLLSPWDAVMVKYFESLDYKREKVHIILPKNISINVGKNDLFIVDNLTYELYAFNNHPVKNTRFLIDIGFENIKKVAELRGRRMIQRTQFKILDSSFGFVKKIDTTVVGSFLVDEETDTMDFDELFVLDSFLVPYSKIPLKESAIVGSIGMATKLFVDWGIKNNLDFK